VLAPEYTGKIDSTRERIALQRHLDSIEEADDEQQPSIDPSALERDT
jgi:hypothetical protein